MSRPEPHPVERGSNRWGARWAPLAAGSGLLWLMGNLLAPRPAYADGPEVADLKYDRAAELAGCPDEAAFRRAVIGRLRRDPFVVGAARKISVVLRQSGATLTALVGVDEAGHARKERRIDARAGCEELASGAALAVSIAIDPLVALGLPPDPAPENPDTAASSTSAEPPQPASKPASAVEPTKPAPTHPVTPTRAPARDSQPSSSRLFGRAGVRAWVGLVPELSVGPSIGLGFESRLWSLALDGIAVLPRSQTVAGTRRAVSVSMVGGELSPCLHVSGFRGCAELTSGALLARGEGVDDTRTGTSLHAAAGIGVGYSFAVGRFFFGPSVSAAARLATSELSLDGESVWTTPRVLASFGLEIGYDLVR